MLMDTYRNAKDVDSVRVLVPALMQTAATPNFVRYLHQRGVEEFINDHMKVFATFDVDSWTVSFLSFFLSPSSELFVRSPFGR